MDVELLSGACGAEIAGIDLRDTSDDNIKIISAGTMPSSDSAIF